MLPFEASRRLIGANLFFAGTGAQLETLGIAVDEALLAAWRAHAARARAALGWNQPDGAGASHAGLAARVHSGGASLALAAPVDALYTATEVNEWALCAALRARDGARWAGLEAELVAGALEDAADVASFIPPVLEEAPALARFARLASREARPRLRALLAEATQRGLPYVLDDETLTLGTGAGSRDFTLDQLPQPVEVLWEALHGVPTALVTGSNGKTTSVRLIAACAEACGWAPAACCCTDGVFVGGQLIAGGDYSGPEGARRVARERSARAAVIETARGGILRRGIALARAQVALVTNVSADHFGEYGIDDLEGLADVKLSVAGVLGAEGVLVLNAADPLLVDRAPALARRFGRAPTLAWFALDADLALLREHRERGGATCGVRAGRLLLHCAATEHDLGAVSTMPLTAAGSATYNIANLAGAALAATTLGIAPTVIATVFARFGASIADNFGRLMRFERDGVRILVDYAHNPAGLRGLLRVAEHLRRGGGRLAVLLGHAGNRQDAELEALAATAAEFQPALIVVKENEAHLRGRPAGEVPQLIHAALLRAGVPPAALQLRMSELEAVQAALDWARPGDVLALPVHAAAARSAVVELLSDRRQ
ncbi:MAG TPA: Mur ligase family protein [Steroidobacteraceae bacterium]|nr:Mur ligase family protein [Steroidobacteraceae bacterium]